MWRDTLSPYGSNRDRAQRCRRLRNRAVRLLVAYFSASDERARRVLFEEAFGNVARDPCPHIRFSGAVAEFAADAVDTLLAFGCTGRGRHYLSVLLMAMREARGRQTDPDYHDLPQEVDAPCALPSRDEEQQYLSRLIEEIENKARLYSPLRGSIRTRPASAAAQGVLHPWQDDRNLALLCHRRRRREGCCRSTSLRMRWRIATAARIRPGCGRLLIGGSGPVGRRPRFSWPGFRPATAAL